MIANPIAGRGRGEATARDLARLLEEEGLATELFLTSGRGSATKRITEVFADTKASPPSLVAVVGGDGTVREIVGGLPHDVPLAALPMGTANVLAIDLKLPREPRALVEIIRAGRTCRIDMALVNDQPSFLCTGVGMDGHIVQEVEERRRGPITKWTYVMAAMRSLKTYNVPALTVELDGELLPGEYGFVLATNVVHYGGVMKLARKNVKDDGLFEVFLFPKGSRRYLLGQTVRAFVGGLERGSAELRLAKRIRVTSEKPVPYQLDGDFGGETPVAIDVTGESFCIFVP